MTMALGAGSVTPMQMAVGYTAFANGGFRVSPYFIQRIEDEKGNILEQAQPSQVAKNAVQIIDPRNAYLMTTMMQDVVERGDRDTGETTQQDRSGRQDRHHQ